LRITGVFSAVPALFAGRVLSQVAFVGFYTGGVVNDAIHDCAGVGAAA
jgi:hypothetical protein